MSYQKTSNGTSGSFYINGNNLFITYLFIVSEKFPYVSRPKFGFLKAIEYMAQIIDVAKTGFQTDTLKSTFYCLNTICHISSISEPRPDKLRLTFSKHQFENPPNLSDTVTDLVRY